MASRGKPAAAEYGARRDLAGSIRELQALRERGTVLGSSLERDIVLRQTMDAPGANSVTRPFPWQKITYVINCDNQ